jgi:hypothetical protein
MGGAAVKLKLQDSNGIEINFGDLVKIISGASNVFYSEVKYLEKEKAIAPFHTFSFLKILKVEEIPSTALKCNEELYNIWYEPTPEKDIEYGNEYLCDWRKCEHLLENRIFVIEL